MKFNINKVKPETKQELRDLINETTRVYGFDCDLNFIDTSLITDMSFLFYFSYFNGDISKWNVRNVINMSHMFYGSKFKGNIDDWIIKNKINPVNIFNDHLKNNNPIWYKEYTQLNFDVMFLGKTRYANKIKTFYK